ncbi:MAG TPA: hypothetical protein VJM11_03910 [Nevskiaceae bacterium]|nr:hypothetical protein [Nevskiaceae bacterium]
MSTLLSRRRLLAAAAGAPLAVLPGVATPACPGTGCLSLKGKQGSVGVVPNDYLVMTVLNPNLERAPYEIEVTTFEGKQLKFLTGELGGGRSVQLRLDPARGLDAGKRVMLHIDVRGKGELPMAGHVEVVNRRSGRTRLTMTPCFTPEPPNLISRGLDGLVNGQRLLVSLFDERPSTEGPTSFRVDFVALKEVVASFEGTTSPGEGRFVEWGEGDHGFPVLEPGQRVQVLTQVYLNEKELEQIAASLEVLDARTGASLIQGRPNCYSI